MTSYKLIFEHIKAHRIRPSFKPPFRHFVKKQRRPFQLAIEDAVEAICAAPDIGEKKVGDLQEIWVYKFSYNQQQYLLAYRLPSDDDIEAEKAAPELLSIDFYHVGVHENFYDALKKYLRSRGLT